MSYGWAKDTEALTQHQKMGDIFHIGLRDSDRTFCGVPYATGWRRDEPQPTKGTICETCRALWLETQDTSTDHEEGS